MKKLLIPLLFFLLSQRALAQNDEKLIALTFDDGPCVEYTLEILDILKKYNARATFFVIGENAQNHPDVIKKIAESGSEIGNHTWSHAWLDRLTKDDIREEFKKTHNLITSITGKSPKIFRAPGGRINDNVIDVANEFSYKSVLWSKDTRDWEKTSVQSVISSALDDVKNGDIILFHDYNRKNSPTPKALLKILPALLESGYKTVTVSELL